MLIPMSRWSANHPIKLCLDHRVALAGDCFEPFAIDNRDMPPCVSDDWRAAVCRRTETVERRAASSCQRS
jgi:hypothetical protein